MTSDLLNALRTIKPDLPDTNDLWQAMTAIRPEGEEFLKRTFWRILCDALPFRKSPEEQKALANWILSQKKYKESKGGPWPPAPLVTKRYRAPLPKFINQV